MAQTYTAATTVIASATASTVTNMPVEQGGGALTASFGVNELNYRNRIAQTGSLTSDAIDLYGELQNFIALMTRLFSQGTQGGLTQVLETSSVAGNVATPREVMFRIKLMLDAMLSQPNNNLSN